LAPVNRRISIVVLNQRAQLQIEKANAANAVNAASPSIRLGVAGQAAAGLSTASPGQRS
jgi:chemotaxis protein MotB